MPDIPPVEPARTLHGSLHVRRMRRMLLLGSMIIGVASISWAVFFMLRGNWIVVCMDLATLSFGATTAVLTHRGHTRKAARLLIAVMYVMLCVNAAVFDIPSIQVPRSVHQFLLALGVASCLLTRDEPVWLRHGIPVVCLLSYLAFASSDLGWASALALPDSVRTEGNWINQTIALVTVYVALHVIQSDVAERSSMENELRDALLRDELVLYYQPQVAAGDRIIGAEALVRWKHPQRGMVSPGEFIPLAEQTGLMLPIGDWVLRTACVQLVAWSRRPETAALLLAVNVSASQFAQPDFVARVLASVERTGADPGRLKLELTESMLAHDLEDIIAKMTALKARGIGFSLDDFGTGFSSLSYLRRLPLDQLKIDQSFVRDMLSSSSDAAIAQAVITLGQSLGLEVIAEGVETLEQRRFLAHIGCQTYQGYLYSRPLPSREFGAFVGRGVVEDGPEDFLRSLRATPAAALLRPTPGSPTIRDTNGMLDATAEL